MGRRLWEDDDASEAPDSILDDAASVAGWIYADWLAGDLDRVEPI